MPGMGLGAYLVAGAVLVASLTGQTGVGQAGPAASTTTVAAAPTAEEGAAPDVATAEPQGVTGPPTSRLAGSDRYGSAVAISRWRFADPAQAKVVYLASGDVQADVLSAGSLTDGPVLLTRADCGAVPSPVLAEITRLDPDKVIAIGGTGAVCSEALSAAAQGRATGRIAGATRAETAALIARRAFPNGADRVYLTRSRVSPDAVVAGSLRDGPTLLLTSTGQGVPAETAAAIQALAPDAVVALGGTAAVSDAALSTAAAGRPTSRLAGADRYGTAVAVAKHAYPTRTARVYLARGDGTSYADAIASGMLTDGPVVLTSGSCERVRSATASFLKARHPDRLVALGGTGVLCDSALVGASMAARPKVDCARTACVALTFDDGPSWPTPTLLDTLASKRVPVTFFTVGQNLDVNGRHARRAHVEGHEVENHTWDHTELPRLTWSQQKWEVDQVDLELVQWGLPESELMRPPYGSYDANTRTLGFPLIIWDVDPQDWRGYSTSYIRQHVVANAKAGSIVLQHDIHINSVNAVPGIIDDLTARGFTFVTVEELVPNMRPGDLVYRRGYVVPRATAAEAGDPVVLPDGTDLGVVLDEGGVEGLDHSRSTQELVDVLDRSTAQD